MNTDAWTCPFCALLCDRYQVARDAVPLRLDGSDCPRAHDALRHFDLRAAPTAQPTIDGTPSTIDEALDAAADALRRSRQALIGGLATDVAGMRAAYRLAAATGAIVDHAHGDAMQRALGALQDRGQYGTTLAEIRVHADLVVCVGTQPGASMPEFWRRCGVGSEGSPLQRVVFVGTAPDARLGTPDGVVIEQPAFTGDLYDTLARLQAAAAGRWPPGAAVEPAIEELSRRLQQARYAVLVWEPAALDTHGSIAAEALQRLVHTLNRRTRAASFAVGGHDGAATAQQVITWLGGLPPRTRISRHGLAHEPLRYRAASLLDDRAVDALVWLSSFGPRPQAPRFEHGARIVLGHPAQAAHEATPRTVYLPVSTPGIGSDGHLFRADGVVALPTPRLVDDGLPTVAALLARIVERWT